MVMSERQYGGFIQMTLSLSGAPPTEKASIVGMMLSGARSRSKPSDSSVC